MNTDIRINNATEIMNSIVKLLRKDGIKVDGRIEYRGTAISIEDKDWNVRMWIRLMWNSTFDKCIIYMSNIRFSDEFQRSGYFTNVINTLKKSKYIENIVIQSVCTDAMRNWCKKHRFSTNEYMSDYFWKA